MNLKKKFVIGAASLALVAGMGVAPAMATASKVVLPGGQSFDRLAGTSRVLTALEIAKQAKADTVPDTKIYIVNAHANIDAATSGMLTDGLVVLAPADEAGQLKLGLELKKIAGANAEIIAVGGQAVVPDAMMKTIKSTSGLKIGERLGGANRYATNLAIAKHAFPASGNPTNVYLVSGTSIVDGVTAGAIVNGPVLMLPTSGTVPADTVSYFKSLKTAKPMIIGGQGAISDAQVGQLFDSTTSTNPWAYQTTADDLKNGVRKAAALYLGQQQWQKLDGTAQTIANCEANTYFGINVQDLADPGTNPEVGSVTADTIKDGVKAAKDAFIGWKPSYDNLETSVGKINTYVKGLEDALNTALEAMATGTPKDDANYSKGGSDVAYTAVVDAYKALYGKDLKLPKVVDGAVTDWGSFEKDALGRFTGKLVDSATSFVKDDAASTDKVGTAAGAKHTYAELAGLDMALPGDITDNDGFDWAALKAAAGTKLADQQAKTAEAKKALAEAVKACKAGPTWKVTEQAGAGIPRLAGQTRYETAALLSYYLTEGANMTGYPAQIAGTPALERAYIASGDDNHLVDAVVGGQLTKGPILLVPTNSDKLGEFTTAEIKRLAKKSGKIAAWKTLVLGGSIAVADGSFNAAVEAFKAGLK